MQVVALYVELLGLYVRLLNLYVDLLSFMCERLGICVPFGRLSYYILDAFVLVF